jgi:hypothetical protein
LTETDATLLDDLKRLVEPVTLGDPGRPLLWVSKSLDKLASALVAMGHSISPNSVRKLLMTERTPERIFSPTRSSSPNPATCKSLPRKARWWSATISPRPLRERSTSASKACCGSPARGRLTRSAI